ncbi:glutamate 5-kinase [Acinetobacter proteolyticus]|nr:glutamate 5-kinase [Acinetobacter proteolyticus]WEI20121.1 glutamate 5-kinase [Acinetobacter proteolyticus]
MGLRDEIQTDIAEAFNADLADAVYSFTCERITQTEWDPVTETSTVVKVNYSGRGVLFGKYNAYEIANLGIEATDKKATLLQNEVTNTPIINDEWVTPQGRFKLIHVSQDPAKASWTCQLRNIT